MPETHAFLWLLNFHSFSLESTLSFLLSDPIRAPTILHNGSKLSRVRIATPQQAFWQVPIPSYHPLYVTQRNKMRR